MTTSHYSGEAEFLLPTQYVGTKQLRYEFSPSMSLEMRLKAFMNPEHVLARRALSLYSDASATVRLLSFGSIEGAYAQQVHATEKYVDEISAERITLTRQAPTFTEVGGEPRIHFQIMPRPEIRERLGSLSIMNIKQHGNQPIGIHFNLPKEAIDTARANDAKYALTDFIAGDLRHISSNLAYGKETDVDAFRQGRFVSGTSLSKIKVIGQPSNTQV